MTSIIGPSSKSLSVNGFKMTNLIADSDASLVEVAAGALKQAGWPSTILTRRLMFTKGDNERNAEPSPKQEL